MAAPTFIASSAGASWDTTTSPKTTGGQATNNGDLVVSISADENDDGNENYAWSSSVAETWTEHTESTGTTNADCFAQSARATTTSAWAAGTVTVTRSAGGASKYNHVATVWRNHAGVGNIGNSAQLTGTAPSYSFTTSAPDSAILVIAADWNARTTSTAPERTYTQINGLDAVELAFFNNTANYTIFVFYFPNAGAAGAKTIQINGIDASVAMRMHAVEVLGAAAATTTASDTGSGADSASVAVEASASDTGAGADSATTVVTVTASDTATGVDTATVDTGATAKTGDDSGAGTDSGSLAAAGSAAETATGTDTGTVAAGATGADTATAVDSAFVTVTLTGTETASAADLAALAVAVAAAELAAALDNATADTGSNFQGRILAAHLSTLAARGTAGTLNASGSLDPDLHATGRLDTARATGHASILHATGVLS